MQRLGRLAVCLQARRCLPSLYHIAPVLASSSPSQCFGVPFSLGDAHGAVWAGAERQCIRRDISGTPGAQQALLPSLESLWAGEALDPFSIVKDEIESISERLRRSIMTGIPVLETAASYFFRVGVEGKRFRPTMLLLMASSLSPTAPGPQFLTVDERPPSEHPLEQRRRQQRIAEITEMIHVASLLHDDVIDAAATRRGLAALNSVLGNKIAILAGDFLLARASVSLASLRQPEVIQLMSQVIEDLVSGEILQMTASPEEMMSLDHYIKKTFFKTASLIANSCKAVAVLSGQPRDVVDLAWDYGRSVGLAFQLVDDVLDFTGTALQLGKPALNDLRNGLVTAPVLYAAEEHPQLLPLIRRKFQSAGDVDLAQRLVADSSGVQRTRDLAAHHVGLAACAIASLPPTQMPHALLCRRALTDITERVLTRTK